MSKDKTCEDEEVINDLETCKDSVSEIKKLIPNAEFRGQENRQDWPKGCYLYIALGKKWGFFNGHQTGSNHANARPICQVQGMK